MYRAKLAPDSLSNADCATIIGNWEQSIGKSLLKVLDLCNIFLVVSVTAITVLFAWTGFLGSDDASYASAATAWLNEFPFVGSSHWALRHPLVIPIALSFRLFGPSEFSLILPTLVYFFGLVGITYIFFVTILNRRLAIIAAIILSTTPLFALNATTASADIVELFYVMLSFWLFYQATLVRRPHYWLLASGIAAGFAWITRETTAGLIIFYGLLFIVGFGVKRGLYWMMGLGFWFVVGAELIYLTIVTGDPLHRIKVDLYAAPIRPSWTGIGLDTAGNLVVHPLVDPLLLLLANQEFALLYYLALPAGLWLCFSGTVATELQRLARLLALLGMTWMIFVGANSGALYLLPRYVAVTTYAADMLVAIWIYCLLWPTMRRSAIFAAAALILANFLGIYVDNRNFFFPERTLIALAAKVTEPVYTDPNTSLRADFLLRTKGLRDSVIAVPPPIGSLYLHVPRNVAKRRAGKFSFDTENFTPRRYWVEEFRADLGRKWSGVIIEWLGLADVLPAEIVRRLDRPEPPVLGYRVVADTHD